MIDPISIKILLAFEHSGTMYREFERLGFSCFSADFKPSTHPGHHYQGNVLDVDLSVFDACIAFPPCTYHAKAGLHLLRGNNERLQAKWQDLEVLRQLSQVPFRYFAFENPDGDLPAYFGTSSQRIFPYYFGDPYRKEINLWLRNLPPVISTCYNTVRKPIQNHVNGRMSQSLKSEIKSSWKWYPGMARAIAEQWGSFMLKDVPVDQ